MGEEGWRSENPLCIFPLNLSVSVYSPAPDLENLLFTYYLQKINFQSFAEVEKRQSHSCMERGE